MQKLVWINGNEEELNLTSGDYGITNWEGFSNTDLNVQSQQVPMQDGSVFLDALLGERQLSVTLAIQDGNDLEKRYRLKRELIHRLNPKLGEGYLIYTNDFISKRIKCIPKLPLFPNKNSNDAGTQKASLSWTACDPYWEDVEETIVDFGIGTQPIITNEGDVPCQLKIDFLTAEVENPRITNLTTKKLIQYNGELLNNLQIITETGNKTVNKKDFNFEYLLDGKTIIHILPTEEDYLIVYKELNYQGVRSYFVFKFYSDFSFELVEQTDFAFNNYCYSENKKLYVAVGNNGLIATSSDGINWTSRTSGTSNKLKDVCYSKKLDKFVVVGTNIILNSSDSITWEIIDENTSYDQNAVCYSETMELFVTVCDTGRIRKSDDGVTWISVSSTVSTELNDIVVAENKALFVVIGRSGVILTSPDGSTWTSQTLSSSWNKICYSEDLQRFIVINNSYNNNLAYSDNGFDWTLLTVGRGKDILFSNRLMLFILGGEEGFIYKSYDGITYEGNIGCNGYIQSITYSKKHNMYCAVGDNDYYKSIDGLTWIKTTKPEKVYNWENLYGWCIFYSERYDIYILFQGDAGGIFKSLDCESWVRINQHNTTDRFYNMCYSKKLDLIIGVGSVYIWRCSNITIDSQTQYFDRISNTELKDVCWSEEKELFVAVGDGGKILTSPDGETWTSQTSGTSENLNSVAYSEELKMFAAVGSVILTSTNGINWKERTKPNSNVLKKIFYSKLLQAFVAVEYDNCNITITSDGITWLSKDTSIINYGYTGIEDPKKESLIICGGTPNAGLISRSKFTETENQIQNISPDSDMNLNLEIGDNQFRLNKTSGSFRARIIYRQKYLGV